MTDATRVHAECEPLSDFLVPPDVRHGAGSCGIDFWQSPAALRWLGAFLDARPALITVRAGTRMAACCCLLRRLPFGFVLASAYPYAAVAGDVELFWRHGEAIVSALRGKRVVRLEMPFTGEYAAQLQPFAAGPRCFRTVPGLDAVRHVLDLGPSARNPDWLAGQLAPNTRWAIRKAERMGGSVRLATSDDLEVVQAIYAAAMHAKGAPVNYGPERFQGMLEELSTAGSSCVYLGAVNGKPAGMAAVLDAGLSRHLLQLAVIPGMQSTRLSELLVSTAIGEAISAGRHFFDFMASSPEDTGLIAFKAKWATREEAIRYAVLRVNPWLDLAVDFGRWFNARRARIAARKDDAPPEMSEPGSS
jgi:hypothetical protein